MRRAASDPEVIPPLLRVLGTIAFAGMAYTMGEYAYEAWVDVASPNGRLYEVVRMGGLSLAVGAGAAWLAVRGTRRGMRLAMVGFTVVHLVAAWVAMAYPPEHGARLTLGRMAVIVALTLAAVLIFVWDERSERRSRPGNAAGEEAP